MISTVMLSQCEGWTYTEGLLVNGGVKIKVSGKDRDYPGLFFIFAYAEMDGHNIHDYGSLAVSFI